MKQQRTLFQLVHISKTKNVTVVYGDMTERFRILLDRLTGVVISCTSPTLPPSYFDTKNNWPKMLCLIIKRISTRIIKISFLQCITGQRRKMISHHFSFSSLKNLIVTSLCHYCVYTLYFMLAKLGEIELIGRSNLTSYECM